MPAIHLNPIAIGVASLGYFLVGAIWFSPVVFFSRWLSLIGRTREDLQQNFSYFPLIWGAVTAVSVSLALACLLEVLDVKTALGAAGVAALVWAFLIGAPVLNSYLFEGRPVQLFWLNMGYPLVAMILAGAILGAWPAS